VKKATKKHYSYLELKNYLTSYFNDYNESDVNKSHFDSCRDCWNLWNRVRWDAAKKTKGLSELKSYLGKDFKEYYDSSWALADEWNKKNPHTKDEIINFYKNTKNYLFNLVIWHESGERRNFQEDLKLLLEKFSIKSVIDFGCGVGSDSLFLLENNIETFMIDFNCPSTDFLKWRMAKRNLLEGKFLDADNIDVLPASEMFWAIDVLEHIPDPEEVIEKLSDETKIFVHHSPFNNQAGGRHPCHIYFEEQKLNDALQNKGFRNIPWRNMSVWVKEYLL